MIPNSKENMRTCLYCDKELQGRLDKKFCNDQCRASYNNRHKRSHEQAIQKVNSQIRKNRTILKTLCPTGKATIRKEVLDNLGFSFRHFTSMHKKEATYYLCYDYAYRPLVEQSRTEGREVKKVIIVQYQPFMKDFDPWRVI